MDVNEITIGIGSIGSLLLIIVGLFNWILKLKSRMIVMETAITNQFDEDDKIHNRITRLQEEVKDHKKLSDKSTEKLTREIHEMEKNIIREIHTYAKK